MPACRRNRRLPVPGGAAGCARCNGLLRSGASAHKNESHTIYSAQNPGRRRICFSTAIGDAAGCGSGNNEPAAFSFEIGRLDQALPSPARERARLRSHRNRQRAPETRCTVLETFSGQNARLHVSRAMGGNALLPANAGKGSAHCRIGAAPKCRIRDKADARQHFCSGCLHRPVTLLQIFQG